MARGARRRRLPGRPRAAAARLRRAARRRSTRRGGSPSASAAPIYLKREDLLHTGAHKINNALGQALLAKRMGKTRIIAETGAGQHGVATATACALLGLECVVYMGTEDMRRQQPNVQRMGLLGATVEPVEAGARTLKEAVSAAIRDWVANVGDTHYIIGSSVGPAPFPALVRDLQRVIGDEARAQVLEQAGRLPERVIACVGGGSNAIGIFVPFVDDAEVELIGVEAAGDGIETGRHGAPLTLGGRGGVLHGAYSAIMQDEDGQILEAHSISAGLDYPGTGPQHAHLRDTGRATYEAVTDARGARRVPDGGAARGHHPGARVLARGRLGARRRPVGARPDLPLRARGQGPRRGAVGARAMSTGIERIAAAFAATDGRAALMPYLMGGFPDLEASRAIGEAYADGGADLVELGVPFSDPLADGPVIHAAGTQALAAGRHRAGRARARAGARRARPGRPHVLREPRAGARRRALRRRAGAGGCQRSDRAGPPARGGAGRAARRATRPGSRSSRWSPRRRRTSGWPRIGAQARGFVYTVSVTGTTGERDGVDAGRAARAGEGAHRGAGRARLRDPGQCPGQGLSRVRCAVRECDRDPSAERRQREQRKDRGNQL